MYLANKAYSLHIQVWLHAITKQNSAANIGCIHNVIKAHLLLVL